METNITRRRLLQGVGAAGIAGVAGNALLGTDAGVRAQADTAALRVAHLSPDAPGVTVRLTETGTDTGTDQGTTADGEDDPLVEGLSFSEVSDYSEVDPGTYRLEVVAVESVGFLEGILGGEGQQRVVYDEAVEVDGGTTYTAVAYGELSETELAQAGADEGTTTDEGTATDASVDEGTATDDGLDAGDDVLVEGLGFGESESVEVETGNQVLEFRETAVSEEGDAEAEGTETDGEATPPGDITSDESEASSRAFRVGLLEDELDAPDGTDGTDAGTDGTPGDGTGTDGESETARLRAFNAVPDVNSVTVVAVEGGGLFGGGGGDQGDTATATATDDGVGAGDGTATETGTPEAPQRVEEASISPEAGVVYSGFAAGYFDPQAVAIQGSQPDDSGGDGVGTATPTDGPTGGDGGTPSDDIIEDIRNRDFEFVTVRDASDGERADGGTGGGLLPDASAPAGPAPDGPAPDASSG